jgi:hypothetical protein
MRKHFMGAFVLALGVAMLVAKPVSAATITTTTIAGFGNVETHLNDDSFEQAFDALGAPKNSGDLVVGDKLGGVFNIANFGPSGGGLIPAGTGGQPEVTGIFEAQILAIVPGTTGFNILFGPSASFQTTYGTGAMAALFSDPADNFAAQPPPAALTQAQSLARASDGTLLAIAGFTGVGGTAGAYEGWLAHVDSLDLALASSSGRIGFGFYAANLNLIDEADFAFLNITRTEPSPFPPAPGVPGFTDIVVSGQLFGKQSATNVWPLGDSTDIFFNQQPVPEPGSMLMWGGLSVLVGIGAFRRKKAVAA